MSGFNFEAGRSNNMVLAEAEGKITIGRWAKRYGVSAASAVAVMQPDEAHHTGTGRRGTSRLTPVIESATEPTCEQIARMEKFDSDLKAPPKEIADCVCRWMEFDDLTGAYGRIIRRNCVPREKIEKVAIARIFADGKIECQELIAEMRDGTEAERVEREAKFGAGCYVPKVPTGKMIPSSLTTGWHKLAGLVIAKDGLVIRAENINTKYDSAPEIAERICK